MRRRRRLLYPGKVERPDACASWARLILDFAQIAQLVEHTLGKGEVGSSNLLLGSKMKRRAEAREFIFIQ